MLAPLLVGGTGSASEGAHFPASPSHYTHPLVLANLPSAAAGAAAGPLGCPFADDQCWFSYNWAGYAVYSSSYVVTSVSGSWRVPYIVGATATTCPDYQKTWDANSVWVGIDGFMTPTVEQTGTDSDCFYGQPAYYAWYEFYPAGSVQVPYTVNPGDLMTATAEFLYYNATGVPFFQTIITDETSSWTFASPVTPVPGAALASAEWIEESPYYYGFLGLTHVTRVQFTGISATINGVTGPMSTFGTNQNWILSVDYNFPYVTPYTLAYAKAQPQAPFFRGSGFGVNWLSDGP